VAINQATVSWPLNATHTSHGNTTLLCRAGRKVQTYLATLGKVTIGKPNGQAGACRDTKLDALALAECLHSCGIGLLG
jgi:hypothetical protein